MSDIPDIEYLIRLRAQIMDFDEDMGGWIPHSGGGLAEIIVGKHLILSFNLTDEDISGSEEASSSAPSTTPQYEYYIQGNHNNKFLLECKIKKDFMFVEVMPTLFHYTIDEAKPRGLMFQTNTDMKNFINIITTIIKEVKSGKEIVQQHEVSCELENKPLRVRYNSMDQIHVYPSGSAVTAEINPPIMKSPPLSPSHGILKEDGDAESTTTKTIKRRVLCRYCGKRFFADNGGECEFASDRFRSCIDIVSCVNCAKGMTYHCLSDEEGDFETEPCACTPVDGCAKRWLGLSLLSMCIPCLCCYLPLRCVHRAARAVRLIRVAHAPQLDETH